MLNKKILFLVIFNILNFTHSYSNELSPVINTDLLNKINPEVVYFENHKWNFLKKELVDKVNILSEDNSLREFTFVALFEAAVYIFAEISLKKDKEMKPFLYLFRGLFFIVCFFYVTNLLMHKSLKNKLKQDNLLKVMDDFFKNYSTDPNITLKINYRRFVPQELLATFDAIYEIYKNDGTDSLNAFTNIFNDIRNQFLPKKEQYIII
ncbi:hypothetical protein KJ644_04490 [Candidatus Dependentiae bacterium]|nr:hypothetical protein [Candidatus Dependentiae bacterium]MBU4387698.1 hypothetical protein [Candidatus Dependentiae bacterium]MCG2756598.1 hypothetical protein [Candidatus Dependentiae bacterium]